MVPAMWYVQADGNGPGDLKDMFYETWPDRHAGETKRRPVFVQLSGRPSPGGTNLFL